MKNYQLILALTVSMLPSISNSSEPIKCTSEPGKIIFLASEVNPEFDCAKMSGKDSFVNKVVSIEGDTLKIQNLENGVIWERKNKLCGYASQEEAEAATRQLVAECKAKKAYR